MITIAIVITKIATNYCCCNLCYCDFSKDSLCRYIFVEKRQVFVTIFFLKLFIVREPFSKIGNLGISFSNNVLRKGRKLGFFYCQNRKPAVAGILTTWSSDSRVDT